MCEDSGGDEDLSTRSTGTVNSGLSHIDIAESVRGTDLPGFKGVALARSSSTSSDSVRISVRASVRKLRNSALSRFNTSPSATSDSSRWVSSELSACGWSWCEEGLILAAKRSSWFPYRALHGIEANSGFPQDLLRQFTYWGGSSLYL